MQREVKLAAYKANYGHKKAAAPAASQQRPHLHIHFAKFAQEKDILRQSMQMSV